MTKNFLYYLHKTYWIVSTQLGFDLRVFLRTVRGLPFFIRDWLIFRKNFNGKLNFMPCIQDRFAEGGSTKTEYFWQDLQVARMIFAENPVRHIDIGSRVDGFVAHLASFRECEVIDVRPINTTIPGVLFRQADLINPDSLGIFGKEGYCDSLSCLHAIEHFGLGRYGDPIDQNGFRKGIANMASLLLPGGKFYLSTPIGLERVEFNANWVFDPRTIVACGKSVGLTLERLFLIDPIVGAKESQFDFNTVAGLAAEKYHLALFIFTKDF